VLSSATSSSREFGRLLRKLRGSLDQTTFGHRFGGYSASTISAYENGTRRPNRRLIAPLVQGFPKSEKTIEAAYDAMLAEQAAGAGRKGGTTHQRTLRQIEDLLIRNQRAKASEAIRRALETAQEPTTRVRLLELNGQLHPAIAEADAAGLHREAARLRDEAADALIRGWSYDQALELIDGGLASQPEAGALWRRRGLVRWHQGCLEDAYASLTTALAFGVRRPDVTLVRGQVLADWRKAEEAIKDLDEALHETTDQIEETCARSVRAYALVCLGEVDAGLQEITLAAQLGPMNGWVRYYEGLCYREQGRHSEMLVAFEVAVQATTPGNLTESQMWNISTWLLDELERNPNYDIYKVYDVMWGRIPYGAESKRIDKRIKKVMGWSDIRSA
jgi:tetratricopeptide (TPR) repeat protein